VYSCDGRVEVMLFREEFKQTVDRLNSAIAAVVSTAQRKYTTQRQQTSIYICQRGYEFAIIIVIIIRIFLKSSN